MTDTCKITRALISVSDKTGLVEVARELAARGVEILSTGGSAEKLRQAGVPVKEVSDYTGFPEMMDGRVKTLHPKIHGGLLQVRTNDTHKAEAEKNNIPTIDLVIVNLYPFRETVARGADFDTCIENIDIGGPAMVRSAAKNHAFVTIITDPAAYDELLAEMKANNGATTLSFRRTCAATAYAHTASYDSAVSTWFAGQLGEEYPETITFSGALRQSLRYGENPHQSAAFYVNDTVTPSLATAIQVQGKELSYNNINDTDAAFELVSTFTETPAIAIIKHANPCGVAIGASLLEAYERALACDSVSAFGGIIACNRPLDGKTAAAITKIFSEVIIAPDMDDEAKEILAAKKNLRVLLTRDMPNPARSGRVIKSVAGGFLVQSRDNIILNTADLKVVTKRQPTEAEMRDMIFAFTVAKHVKSNTIVYAKDGATVGIGAGQMSRVDSARIAARKAEDAAKALGLAEPLTKGCVAASDAFFPFADGLLSAIEAGATCVIQPGGSIRDDEVIKAADDNNIAMVLSGIRHFYH
ncbi:MAG: bifunctional phosphoribosylaminoimidazolecarboxamide formyltransferase/IMP cyclohydrolase [Alphaproteobacteria bacterium]|jgi:phosphoribosylaminoimidazolecarboxamide formyltransferase/IMP cyclohydrolase|nr:bifunctional phosphoribosylaminoimidazolecarboxamide formyltransferase/IMP cyclohydrolase [Alphaproteobacteria bacterium]